ncbi:MAG: hypothetical protein M3N53_00015 [Actinomycetota bacterium]|nr:hypothetical protein [Actinomycetota bacterium]
MEPDDRRLVIESSPRKAKRNLFVVGLTGVVLLVAAVVPSDQGWAMRAFSLVGAAICAGVFVAGRAAQLGRKPLLVADRDGLHHEKVGLIPWADIQSVRVEAIGLLGPVLRIEVNEREKYIARHRNPVMRVNMRIGKATGHPFLALPGSLLERSPEELKAELERVAGRTF